MHRPKYGHISGRVSEGADGFVAFLATGEPAAGEFRCSDCGYGVSVRQALPICPMCGGTAWEQPYGALSLDRELTAQNNPLPSVVRARGLRPRALPRSGTLIL